MWVQFGEWIRVVEERREEGFPYSQEKAVRTWMRPDEMAYEAGPDDEWRQG